MMSKPTKPQIPAHLMPETKAWFAQILADYALESHHIRLLTLACEAFDRAGQARDLIAEHGLLVPTADGSVKANPAIGIERDNRLAFARLMRELDLDAEPPAAAPRGPALPGYRR